ncbi:MAG: hypothetical protein SV201_05765 [Pseudomonadota bacterium]|nr:hypothetical protein [Pseudomonadota bacterium]
MACDCIANIETKALQKMQAGNDFKKPVTNVAMGGVVFSIGQSMSVKTVNKLEITLEGQKKKATMNMVHTFCPFCGTKYNEEE